MLIIHTWFLLTVYIQVSQVYNIIIRLTHANVWESMKKPCRCMQFIKAILFATSHARIRISTTSHKNPYYVLNVMCVMSELAMKLKVCMIKSLSP